MIRILKAELSYYKKALGIPIVVVCAWIFTVFIVIGESSPEKETDIKGVLAVASTVMLIIYFYELLDRLRTKRCLFLSRLPVGITQIGIGTVLCSVLSWLVVLACFTVTLIVVRPDAFVGLTVISAVTYSGLIYCFVAFYSLGRDLCYVFQRRFRIAGIYNDQLPSVIFPLVVFLVMMFYLGLPVVGIDLEVHSRIELFLFSPVGTFVVNLIGITGLLVDTFVFSRRKSYLE